MLTFRKRRGDKAKWRSCLRASLAGPSGIILEGIGRVRPRALLLRRTVRVPPLHCRSRWLLFPRQHKLRIRMAHDVFISHSAKDKVAADAVCAVLERHGVRCWIAPRDILPGADWAKSILDAIAGSRMLVLVFSAEANRSQHIRREIERAVGRGIPVTPVRVQDALPSDAMEYFLSASHWVDAITPPLEEHLRILAGKLRVMLDIEWHATTIEGDEAGATAQALVVQAAPMPEAVAGRPIPSLVAQIPPVEDQFSARYEASLPFTPDKKPITSSEPATTATTQRRHWAFAGP